MIYWLNIKFGRVLLKKKNVDLVIANQNNFIFTLSELNYLLDTEAKKT